VSADDGEGAPTNGATPARKRSSAVARLNGRAAP
jgi:hypothetical protein